MRKGWIGLLYSGFRAHEVDTPNKLSLLPSLSQALYYTILALGVWGPPVISCRPRGSSSSTFVQRVLPLHDICHASKISNQVNRKKATYNLLSLAPPMVLPPYISKSPLLTSVHCANVLESTSDISGGVSWVSRDALREFLHSQTD